jgi:hypothetical protein
MKLRLEFNTDAPDENGNIFSVQVIENIVKHAAGVPIVLEYDARPLGFITDARRSGNFVEVDARLDQTKPESEFFEKEHIVYSFRCTYQDMDFEQTGNVREITSARLSSIIIEPGRKFPPASTIFTIE